MLASSKYPEDLELESPVFTPEELKQFQDRKFVRGIDRFASLDEELNEIKDGDLFQPK